jgi:hypothetical protein
MTTILTIQVITNIDTWWGQTEVGRLFSFGEFNSIS